MQYMRLLAMSMSSLLALYIRVCASVGSTSRTSSAAIEATEAACAAVAQTTTTGRSGVNFPIAVFAGLGESVRCTAIPGAQARTPLQGLCSDLRERLAATATASAEAEAHEQLLAESSRPCNPSRYSRRDTRAPTYLVLSGPARVAPTTTYSGRMDREGKRINREGRGVNKGESETECRCGGDGN